MEHLCILLSVSTASQVEILAKIFLHSTEFDAWGRKALMLNTTV